MSSLAWMPNATQPDLQHSSRVAVIGSGIAGLASAYYLSRKHDVTVFERDQHIGGHTNTILVESSTGPLPVDTGFIVHNDRTYPNFCRLMEELGVETQLSDMSFSVSSGDGSFEYSSGGLNGFFAQRGNYLKPSHFLLLKEILRFNREAPKFLQRVDADSVTMQSFLDEGRYHPVFIERYLYPMASAVWSMSPEVMGCFPAMTLLRFFDNHGLLAVQNHPQWKTLKGGSHSYLAPLTKPFCNRIQLNAKIRSVTRCPDHVRLEFDDRPALTFDHVVFACHGNQVLPLLADPTDREHGVFDSFETSRNEACLHTDVRMLPQRPAARASWNYRLTGRNSVDVTYDMNRLQTLNVPEQYCLSLNVNGSIAPEKVIRKMVYHHPIFTRAAVRAQARWSEVSGLNRTHFCGAYWFYGFHEDGVRSAQRVAATLGTA